MDDTDERVDTEAMHTLIRAVESATYDGRWDRPSELFALYDARHGAWEGRRGHPVRVRGYAATRFLTAGAIVGSAAHALFRLAANLNSGDPAVEPFLTELRQPHLLGLAVQTEGWMQKGAQAIEAARRSGKRLVDIPGSVEVRFVVAVDIDGRAYEVLRERGGSPYDLDPGGKQSQGSVVESLHRIIAAVTGRTPAPITSVPIGWNEDPE